MDKLRFAVRWNLDQALLWYATRDIDLVEAAAEKEGKASDRLTWWTWQLAQAEPMSEADAEDRRDRRVHGIDDAEPEANDTPSWSALAREFHDLLARNPNVMVSTVDGEWFGFGRFGQGEHGAAILVREDRNTSSTARAIGRGRETLNPLLKTDDLRALVEGSNAPTLKAVATPPVSVKPAARVGTIAAQVGAIIREVFPGGLHGISNADVLLAINPKLGAGARNASSRTIQRVIATARLS